MADNKLELVVEVDVNKANASIKTVNSSLSSIEQSAAKAAHGASSSIDGMTAAMVKGATAGSLLADAIKSAVAWAKEFTVGSVMMAAENAKAEASLKALATAHGVGAAAATRQVAAIEEIGFEYTEAAHAVQRLIVADMDLAKAEGLAKLAKNAAAVQNLSAGEAMDAIVLSIESGASRGLRTLGLFVDFQKEVLIQELKLGRALTDAEEKQVRYNAVMREGANIQGAHAAASQTVEGQLGALRREFNNLREDIGAKFQDDLRALIGNLRGLVGWLKENTDLLTKFGETALWVAGVLATYGLATKIMELAKAIAALNLASLNPYALLAGGVVAAGAIVYSEWKNTQEQLQARYDEMERQALRDDLFKGEVKVDDLRKKGMTDDQIRDLIQLYAMTTGQKPTGMPGTVTPLSLVEMGGSQFQSPSYSNGSLLPGLSGLPSLDKIGGGTPSAAGPTVINITVPGAKEFFEKETVRVVVENPRAVQSAAMTATKANAGRREMTGLQLSPGLIVS